MSNFQVISRQLFTSFKLNFRNHSLVSGGKCLALWKDSNFMDFKPAFGIKEALDYINIFQPQTPLILGFKTQYMDGNESHELVRLVHFIMIFLTKTLQSVGFHVMVIISNLNSWTLMASWLASDVFICSLVTYSHSTITLK